ncbi:hypothetical protein GE115_12110 [Agromyces sp. CFH 90414]|uniref:Uncharacterized protein n=1 Tax=Agromyces agglutinans TaxID=2662258 RepID=A0A6I2F588_9MICO|nr:hypothetical protein [Agromyces agglutinans]MRG60605.1 hypothetical protein [Agromyces agglutinans]
MRWDLLFDDLGWQLDQEQQAEERALALEEERLRLSRLTLRDRLRALAGGPEAVRLLLRGGTLVQARPVSFGRDWMSAELVGHRTAPRCVVPLAAVTAILPGRDQLDRSLEPAAEASSAVADRIPLAFVLRDLARRRAPVAVSTDDGELTGTLDRVARDHVDLALHEPGVARRDVDLQGYRIVALDAIRLVTFD